eukprot:365835-Pelagomonas_calceolata.AAC.1
MVQNWLANLVSESGMVQWLGRYRRGVSGHRSDQPPKNTGSPGAPAVRFENLTGLAKSPS